MNNNVLEYLKSLEINSSNKHEEKEFSNYIVSTIMITNNITTNKSNEFNYLVYLVIQDKKDNKFYNDIMLKEFVNDSDANNYYSKLRLEVLDMSESDIISLLKKS